MLRGLVIGGACMPKFGSGSSGGGSGFSLHTDDLRGSGSTLANFGQQVSAGGDKLQTLGQNLVSHASGDKSGVGAIVAKSLGKATDIAGKVFSEGGRVAGAAGTRLHTTAKNHDDNEAAVTNSLNKIRQPPGRPVKSNSTPPGSPTRSNSTPPGSPTSVYSQPSPPGSPVKSNSTPPGSPTSVYSQPSPPGSPVKSNSTPPGSPVKSNSTPPGSPTTTAPSSDPANPFANRPWFGNSGFRSSADDRNQFSSQYRNYAFHEQDLTSYVIPNHPELRNMPTEDLVGVRGYTTNDYYRPMNTALRTGDQATVDQYDPHIRTTVSGLNQLPSYNGPVSRGLNMQPSDLDKYPPGATVTENGFTSTSTGITGSFPGNTIMHINSVNGHNVATVSDFPGESEVLFGPGARFNVTDRYSDPATGKWHIHMDQVP
jgi:hypothetical protein